MVDRPRLRPFWRALPVAKVARWIGVALPAVQRALRTAEGRERVRRRLAEVLGVPAERLAMRPGPTGAVLVGDVWLEAPVAGGWIAASRFTVQAGRLVVAEVRVFPDEDTALRRENPPGRWSAEVLGVQASAPLGGLTARALHAVRLGQHPRYLREVVRFLSEKYGPDAFRPEGSLAALGLAPATERPRARREFGRPDRFYAELAREYDRLVKSKSRHPNAEIAARRREPVARITGWLHEARARGVLTRPGKSGVMDGELTAYGQRVLREASRTVRRREKKQAVTRRRKR